MLGVGGESAAKRPELCGDDIASLVGLVLKDGEFLVAIQLDLAVVRGGKLGNDDLEPSAVGSHSRAGE